MNILPEAEEAPVNLVVIVFITHSEYDNETKENSGNEEDVCLSNLRGNQSRSNAMKSHEICGVLNC